MSYRALAWVLAAAVLAGALGGCQSQFTRQNYETIYLGAPASAVQDKLGRPTRFSGETWVYEHEMPYYRAEIDFREGNVVEKRWYIEKQGDPKECDRRTTY